MVERATTAGRAGQVSRAMRDGRTWDTRTLDERMRMMHSMPRHFNARSQCYAAYADLIPVRQACSTRCAAIEPADNHADPSGRDATPATTRARREAASADLRGDLREREARWACEWWSPV